LNIVNQLECGDAEKSAYKIQKNEMKKNLCKRGYTKRSIDNELKKVDKLDRNN
jgi:hypothetical protein